jgi:hypothetical protein
MVLFIVIFEYNELFYNTKKEDKMKNISVEVINNSAFITCPTCAFQKHVGVNVKKAKAICPKCKETLIISFYTKKRKYFRKEVNIIGTIFFTNANISVNMTVLDISCKGIKLQMQPNKYCNVGDMVGINFILPDRKKTHIHSNGKIVRMDRDKYSVEFLEINEYSSQMKAIGFWMR